MAYPDDLVIPYRGSRLVVAWAVEQIDEGGNEACPAREFLEQVGRVRLNYKLKFHALIKRYANGQRLQEERFRPLSEPFFELKIDAGPGYRLFGYSEGSVAYLTHGCRKPGKNAKLQAELTKANNIRKKHIILKGDHA